MLKAAKGHQQACRAEYKNAYDDNDYVVVMEDGRPFRPNYLSVLYETFRASFDTRSFRCAPEECEAVAERVFEKVQR